MEVTKKKNGERKNKEKYNRQKNGFITEAIYL